MARNAIKVDAKVAFDGVIKALEDIVPGVTKELDAIKLQQMMRLASKVQSVAPHKSGRYSAAIRGAYLSAYPAAVARAQAAKTAPTTGARLPTSGSNSVDPTAVGLFAPYIWAWLEFGTVKMTRRPHIYPTYRAWRPLMRRSMTAVVNKAVKKAVADGNTRTASVAASQKVAA